MGQGVHARFRRDGGRQGHRKLRIQDRPAGDQAQVADGVLVVRLVRHHGGNGGFRPRAGSGGHRRKGHDFFPHPQKPLHLRHGAVRASQPRRCGLGGVHRRAAADGHQTVAPFGAELPHHLLHGFDPGVGRHRVKPAPCRQLFRHGDEFRCGALAAAGHDHGLFASGVLQQLRQPRKASCSRAALRFPPRQHPRTQRKCRLKDPAIYFFQQHGFHILSEPYYAAFLRIMQGGKAVCFGFGGVSGADRGVRPYGEQGRERCVSGGSAQKRSGQMPRPCTI